MTAVLTVLGRPSYDEKSRKMTADVRAVPMKSPPSGTDEEEKLEAAAATMTVVVPPPPHSPPTSSTQPRSVSLTRAALLIDQLPMSDGYIGNQYGYANDCLSTMSPSCNPFAGTGIYRPGFVGEEGFFFQSFFFSTREEKRDRKKKSQHFSCLPRPLPFLS